MKYLFFFLFVLFASCKKSSTEILPPQISSITLNGSISNVVIGGALQLQVSYSPSSALIPEYEWFSDNPNVVTITSDGKVYANSIGSVTITVKVKKSNLSSQQKITVIPGTITSLTLDKTQINLFVNQQQQINVSVLPISALLASVKWTSSDPSIVQVSPSGLVTALAPGKAVVSATSDDGKINANSNIEVVPEIRYTRNIFDKIKIDLLDQLILYNEQQGKALALELAAGKVGYIVQAVTVAGITYLSSNPGYPDAEFSKLKIPSGEILKINSNFYMELFPTTSRLGTLTLDINFLEKSWEIKGTRIKVYSYKYSDNVTLNDLKAIIDQNISDVRRYVTTGN